MSKFAADIVHGVRARLIALRRPVVLGVMGMIHDERGRFLLVRHTYTPGWHFPGGAVDPGEGTHEAIARELDEEVGVTFTDPPQIFGVYKRPLRDRMEHIVIYLIAGWRREPRRCREIAESAFFDPAAPPENTAAGTRRRLEELAGTRAREHTW